MPLGRGGQPLLARVPELEIRFKFLFYVAQLLVVLRGNDAVTRGRIDGVTVASRRVDAIFPKFNFAPC
jgi:hypothetical protein